MKRVISLLLTFVMILSMMTVSVMAAEPASVTAKADYSAKVINVVYNNTANYNCYVTIYMVDVKECDKDIFDYQKHDIIRMTTVEADALSEAKATLVLGDDIKTGDYNIYAAPSGKNGKDYYAKIEKPISIFGVTADDGKQTAKEVLDFINEGNENNISTKAFEKLKDALDISGNPVWRNAYLFAIREADFGGNFANITEVGNAIDIAEALYVIRNASSDTLAASIEAGSDVLGLDIKNADYKNEKFSSVILESYAKRISDEDVKTKVANKTAFDESIALAVINKGSVEEKAAALTTYQKQLGISDDLLVLIKDKGTVIVARHFDSFTATKTSDVVTKVTAILAAIAKEPSDDSSSGSSGSNGGSGASFGGGSIGGGITVPNDFVTNPAAPGYTATFTDVPATHWANEPVEYLASTGVLSGKGDGIFAPNAMVTREEFVKMIVSAFKYTTSANGVEFADVPSTHWAYEFIKIAYENGIINGVSDAKFGVGAPITRQDMAVIIDRVIKQKEIPVTMAEITFTDNAKIASYAKDAVSKLAGAGVLNGYNDGSFKPQGSLTRAEAAKVIYALISR